MICNCLVQSKTYAPTGNRDLEIAPTLRSWIETGIKLQHDEPTFPNQIDRLNSYDDIFLEMCEFHNKI